MSAPLPDPDSMSLLSKVITAAAAVFTPVAALIAWQDRRFKKKADKLHVDTEFKKLHDEHNRHRGYFKDIFEQIRENEQRAQDRHERLMERLSK